MFIHYLDVFCENISLKIYDLHIKNVLTYIAKWEGETLVLVKQGYDGSLSSRAKIPPLFYVFLFNYKTYLNVSLQGSRVCA